MFLEPGRKMVPRTLLEAHVKCFWSLVAKWLPGGPWRLILSISGVWWQSGSQEASLIPSISGAWWQNGSQEASGDSFWAFLEPVGKMAPRRSLEAHVKHFLRLVPKWLPGGL